jgi:hypothetical protein
VESYAVGSSFNLVLTEKGDMLAFGRNLYGQLGNGDTESTCNPTQISLKLDSEIASFGACEDHAFLLTGDGDLYLWGSGREGNMARQCSNFDVPTLMEGFKFRVPRDFFVKHNWDHVFYWLFLGRSDISSIFSTFPVEVLYQIAIASAKNYKQ